jgi:hypothetical protein
MSRLKQVFFASQHTLCNLLVWFQVPCMDGARSARKKSDISAKRSGAAMYSAFECDRFGRWP